MEVIGVILLFVIIIASSGKAQKKSEIVVDGSASGYVQSFLWWVLAGFVLIGGMLLFVALATVGATL